MGLRGKRILLTGASGFVGRHLSVELRRQGAEVITLAAESHEPIDVRDWPSIRDFGTRLDRIDLAYHLAGLMFVPYSFDNPREVYDVNVLGTLNILELCRLYDIPKLVFASSYVYGQPTYLPIDEGHALNPANPYARSKVLGEGLCKAYHEDYGISCTLLRFFNLYGEGQHPKFLIPSIMAQLNSPEIVLADPEPRRDFLYVRDAVDAYIKAGEYDKANYDVFNIGSGESYAVSDIVDKVLEAWGRSMKVQYDCRRRRDEIMNVVADIRKAELLLSWQPSVRLQEGLRRCVDWYRCQQRDAGR
jgi:nucleoside-diphosphate-sugar epimerase